MAELDLFGVDRGRSHGPRDVDAAALITTLRAQGMGWQQVARRLNAAAVPTPSGRGRWHSSSARHADDPAAWAAYMRAWRARRR